MPQSRNFTAPNNYFPVERKMDGVVLFALICAVTIRLVDYEFDLER